MVNWERHGDCNEFGWEEVNFLHSCLYIEWQFNILDWWAKLLITHQSYLSLTRACTVLRHYLFLSLPLYASMLGVDKKLQVLGNSVLVCGSRVGTRWYLRSLPNNTSLISLLQRDTARAPQASWPKGHFLLCDVVVNNKTGAEVFAKQTLPKDWLAIVLQVAMTAFAPLGFEGFFLFASFVGGGGWFGLGFFSV